MDENSRINALLNEIEEEYNIEILFAIENGARVWGFTSEDSDFDVRFVYKSPLLDYLKVGPKSRDTIDKMTTIENIEYDIVGWNVRKFLFLLSKTNPTCLEWLSSPVLYRGSRDFVGTNDLFLRPKSLFHHYISLAKSNYYKALKNENQEVKIKKYLYTMRGIINSLFVLKHSTIPPMDFMSTLRDIEDDYSNLIDAEIKEKIVNLITLKKKGEQEKIKRDLELETFIEEIISKEKEYSSQIIDQKKDPPIDEVNHILFSILNLI